MFHYKPTSYWGYPYPWKLDIQIFKTLNQIRMRIHPVAARRQRLGSVVPWPRLCSPLLLHFSHPLTFGNITLPWLRLEYVGYQSKKCVDRGVTGFTPGSFVVFVGKVHQPKQPFTVTLPAPSLFQSIFESASYRLQRSRMWNIPSYQWPLNLPYSKFNRRICTGRESNIGKVGLHGHQSTCNRNSHLQGVGTWYGFLIY